MEAITLKKKKQKFKFFHLVNFTEFRPFYTALVKEIFRYMLRYSRLVIH